MIKDLRQKQGWSQAQLAKILGVKVAAVSRWEREVSSPRPKNYAKMLSYVSQGGLWITEARRRKGLLQKELAKRLDVPPSLVSYWEQGHRKPSPEQLTQLFNILFTTH